MKIKLPISLRTALAAVLSATICSTTTSAGSAGEASASVTGVQAVAEDSISAENETGEGSSSSSGSATDVSLVLTEAGDLWTLTVTSGTSGASAATVATGSSSLAAGGAVADVYSVVTVENDVSSTENYVIMEAAEAAYIQNATSVAIDQLNTSADAEITTDTAASVQAKTFNVNSGQTLTLDGVQLNVTSEQPSSAMQNILESDGVNCTSSTVAGAVVLENGATLAGTGDAIIVSGGFIGGTGTVSGVILTGESSLQAGNSPGILTISDLTTSADGSNTWTVTVVTNAVTAGSENNDTNSQISQFRIVGDIALNGENTFVLNLQTATTDSSGVITYASATTEEMISFAQNLTAGTSFQFFDLDEGSLTGSFSSYDWGGTLETLLNKGLIWDVGSLASTGAATVRSANAGDATRAANTLVSASQTLFAFADGARNHIYSDRVTGSNIWAGGIGDFQNVSSHNGRTGYKFNGGGFAVGIDHKTGKNAVVGLSFGQMYGRLKPKSGSFVYDAGKIDQDTTMFSLYAGTLISVPNFKQDIQLDGYIAYGSSSNKSSRSVNNILLEPGTATANWNEDVFAVGGRAGWVYQVCPAYNLRPFIGLDYTAARMESFRESGAGLNNRYSDGHYQNLALSVGFAIDRTYTFCNDMALTPIVGVAYVGDVVRQNGKVTITNPDGSGFAEHSVSPGRNAIRANAALSWKICKTWSAYAGYVFECRSGASLHGVNASLSYSF